MTSQQIDAGTLCRSLVAQLCTRLTSNCTWPVTDIISGDAWIARRLAHNLSLPRYGVVNVAMHRNDYAKRGLRVKAQPTTLPFDVNERRILLMGDVLTSGRTIHAAINKLFDYGRLAAMELAVLVDHGERQLSAAPGYIGERIALPANESLVPSEAGEGATVRFTFTCEPKGT